MHKICAVIIKEANRETVLSDRFKVCGAMLAQRADIIFGKLFAFVDIAADLADIAFLFGFGLGFHIFLVVGVGHGLQIGQTDALETMTYTYYQKNE